MSEEIKIFENKGFPDYELEDTGAGEKLERVGSFKFTRPQETATWAKSSAWENADAIFKSSKAGGKGTWAIKNKKAGEKQVIEYKGIKFSVFPTPFRHFGFFPEQAVHWDFIENSIKNAGRPKEKPIKFLNLFGYTGVASLFALRAGAEVTHLDASKQSIDWAKENQKLNGFENMPMRVIVDDVIKFLEREIKRGNKYDAIIMDPPKFGRGPDGEVWKIEESLQKLLGLTRKVLSDKPLFVITTSYATDSSSLSLGYALREAIKGLEGKVQQGELCITEASNGRLIPLANTAVWSS
jgi:23S rRNA (cytosine1962-C5)-methyltransferase